MSFIEPPSPYEVSKMKGVRKYILETIQESQISLLEFKGLRKLKYYCQLCKRQCNDQNGFECHLNSNYHQKHAARFNSNPKKFIEEFSRDFEEGYMCFLEQKYGNKTVLANDVYQQCIKFRDHVHMNATKWDSLTGFCKYLQEQGKIELEQTEKGLYITLKQLTAQEAQRRLVIANIQKEDQIRKQREKNQIDRSFMLAQKYSNNDIQDIQFNDEKQEKEELQSHQPIQVSFNKSNNQSQKQEKTKLNPINSRPTSISIPVDLSLNSDITIVKESLKSNAKRKKDSGLEIIKLENQAKIEKKAKITKDSFTQNDEEDEFMWLTEGIIVKIKDDKLKKYFDQKAKVIEVVEPYLAKIQVLSHKVVLKIDQQFLETVLPSIGGRVKVLKDGQFFGKTGVVVSVNQETYSILVLVDNSDVTIEVKYELISKLASD